MRSPRIIPLRTSSRATIDWEFHMPERIDDEFFDALTAGDARRLEALLEERFLIVDVMSGAVADRAALVAALDDCARCRPAAPSRTPRRRACTGC